MPKITFMHPDGRVQGIVAPTGFSIMHAATTSAVSGILGECGGSAVCATCHVYVDSAWVDRLPAARENELDMLDCTAAERCPESRLSCQIKMESGLDGLVLHIPASQV